MRLASPPILLAFSALLASACRDNGPREIGPPAQIVVVAGSPQSALANTDLATPVQIAVRDSRGRAVPEVAVTFRIVAGGGSFPGGALSAAATTDASGIATAPVWRVGNSAVEQRMRAEAGSVAKDDITATVTTSFNIDVRFYGTPMTPEQQAMFNNAAARISAIITGDVINAGTGQDITPSSCGAQETQPVVNGVIDDVVIFASIQSIDGSGKILAQAGPCFLRDDASELPAVGLMEFDSADLQLLGPRLEEVIIHEMLHVIGIGTLWGTKNLLVGGGTGDPRYTGAFGIQGCQQVGGSVACATSVPVANTGGTGTVDAHWRESTFGTELMTGEYNTAPGKLSLLSIMSLRDLGYVVNTAPADVYTIASNTPFRALVVASAPAWERVLRPVGVLPVVP